METDGPELEVTSKRMFPPLYVPTGDASTDRLAFFHVLERLKVPVSLVTNDLRPLTYLLPDSEAHRMGGS